jgi:hypothetical protein
MITEAYKVLQNTLTKGGDVLRRIRMLALDTIETDSMSSKTTRRRY